jgi:anthranilate/para-aminobenzoate synthase component I
LVGGFTYEGDFSFESYDASGIEVVGRDYCLPESVPHEGIAPVAWQENISRSVYNEMVQTARRYIEAGDIYQVNLARSFETVLAGEVDPIDFFKMLNWITQSPLGGVVPLGSPTGDGSGGRWVCSSSPELFLRIDGRQIQTRPIKGTRPRDRDPMQDRQNAFELRTSPKEIAELVMITDLERNDLGRICEYGSVHVPELLHSEVFSHVHHLISTVEGRLRADIDVVSAVRACFPGGSITGAPKKRAMEIIRELEPESRGIYTGSLGYFGFDGTAQFNIAIRSCELSANGIKFFTGSGITWGSEPDKEYEETCHKAAGILQAVDAYAANCREQIARGL